MHNGCVSIKDKRLAIFLCIIYEAVPRLELRCRHGKSFFQNDPFCSWAGFTVDSPFRRPNSCHSPFEELLLHVHRYYVVSLFFTPEITGWYSYASNYLMLVCEKKVLIKQKIYENYINLWLQKMYLKVTLPIRFDLLILFITIRIVNLKESDFLWIYFIYQKFPSNLIKFNFKFNKKFITY